jgi:hypothetical protein
VASEPRQQFNEPTQIAVPEMCPARSDDHRRLVGDEISPLARKSGQLSGIIVEEDSVLAHVCRHSSNWKTRPRSGWKGCVTRNVCGAPLVGGAIDCSRECLCGAFCAIDQRGVPQSDDPVGRAAFSTGRRGVHDERNHQGLENRLIIEGMASARRAGRIRRRPRFGAYSITTNEPRDVCQRAA